MQLLISGIFLFEKAKSQAESISRVTELLGTSTIRLLTEELEEITTDNGEDIIYDR